MPKHPSFFLCSLFSDKYPAVGETHALSVLAGVLRCDPHGSAVYVFDMVVEGKERYPEMLEAMFRQSPDVVCISIGYGTFSKLRALSAEIKRQLPFALRVYGGAIANYIAPIILNEIDSEALIVRGEGERAISSIARLFPDIAAMRCIPNVISMYNGQIRSNASQLADLQKIGPPSRNHLATNSNRSFQVFTEHSRGCGWAGCTFCLRGLLDVEGKKSEYREFPIDRTIEDLHNISNMGFRAVTFADEDFFGETKASFESAVHMLEAFRRSNKGPDLHFDVSATPQSFFHQRMTEADAAERRRLVERAQAAGLRKVFLGIESGSDSQLKRYAKGSVSAESLEAIRIAERAGLDIELGWIMFDPLLTLREARENLEYLFHNKLSKYVSYIFNEIRIQRDSRYLMMMRKKYGPLRLVGDEFDYDTLTYPHTYLEPDVTALKSILDEVNGSFQEVHYLLKNLTRFGITGAAGSVVSVARELLSNIRNRMVERCLDVVSLIERDQAECSESRSDLKRKIEADISEFKYRAADVARDLLSVEPEFALAQKILVACGS